MKIIPRALVCFILLMVAGCMNQVNTTDENNAIIPTTSKTVIPLTIDCTIAYFPNEPGIVAATRSISLSSETGDAEEVFEDLIFHAWYFKGSSYDLRSLKLWVSTSEKPKEEIFGVLYQLSRSTQLENQIISHGFTGLHYIHHPVSPSVLQFWCSAN